MSAITDKLCWAVSIMAYWPHIRKMVTGKSFWMRELYEQLFIYADEYLSSQRWYRQDRYTVENGDDMALITYTHESERFIVGISGKHAPLDLLALVFHQKYFFAPQIKNAREAFLKMTLPQSIPNLQDGVFTQAYMYCRALKKQMSESEIVLTGHAAGGSYALFAALQTQLPARLFHPMPLKMALETPPENIFIYTHKEALSYQLAVNTQSYILPGQIVFVPMLMPKTVHMSKAQKILSDHTLSLFLFDQDGAILSEERIGAYTSYVRIVISTQIAFFQLCQSYKKLMRLLSENRHQQTDMFRQLRDHYEEYIQTPADYDKINRFIEQQNQVLDVYGEQVKEYQRLILESYALYKAALDEYRES